MKPVKLRFNPYHYSSETLLDLYKSLLAPRLFEEKMLILLRQGRLSKWFSGIGQEAISVGVAKALHPEEYLLPLHRNLGLFTARGIPYERLLGQFLGKPSGFTKGRDRSFHFGTRDYNIVGMISHLGPQLSIADGIALADLLEGRDRVTAAFTGDGGTSEGEFHEALNVAAVWDLPVIFIIENNGYGLSTPSTQQFRCQQFIDKGLGYGMKAVKVDGNNILEMYRIVSNLAQELRRKPQPILLEAVTFRMRGHEEASGTKYVPQELFDYWEKRDPVANYEHYLLNSGLLTTEKVEHIRSEIKEEINQAVKNAWDAPGLELDAEQEITDMYAPFTAKIVVPKSEKKTERRFVDAVSDGLRQSLERFPKSVVMGQDVADYGGVFKVTEGFTERFGNDRIRNTPLCESAIVGAGLGLSIQGWKAIVEMQFADFVTCGFNQIVNNLAKIHYRWGQNADVVVRMPTGAGVGAGPFHSQSNEAWFFHTPGLKVVYPSSPYAAKGLLAAAIEDPNPVLYFEHKALYRSLSEEIPDDYYTLPIGEARTVTEGEAATIITYGMGVHWAQRACNALDASVEILDLQSLLPWDQEAVREAVRKTGKVLVCHEDCLTGGVGAEIAAWISEHCFELLDAPVMREGSLDTAVPFSTVLEEAFLPELRIREKLEQLLAY